MQLSKSSSLLALLATPFVVKAADVDQIVPYVTAFYSDFKGNSGEYISYIAGGGSVPPVVLQLYQEVSTYTDDSYTTLISSDFPIAQLSNWVTGLPWYKTRLSAEVNDVAAATTSAAATSKKSSSAAATTSSSSAAAAETSKASSVLSSASSSASKAVSSSSSAAESAAPSVAETSSTSGAGGVANANVNPMILVPLVALSAGAFLL